MTLITTSALLFLGSAPGHAQAPRDPTAVALIRQALAKLSGGETSVRDLTLEATVTYRAGSDVETGTATLQALGDQQSRVILNLSGGQRQQVRSGSTGAWTGPDGKGHAMSGGNCWTEAAWFSPLLVLVASGSDATVVLLNLGPAIWNGTTVNHVRLYRAPPGLDARTSAAIQQVSTEDLYFDPATGLPVALDFKLQPDHAGAEISTEIRYSDYQKTEGGVSAFHVQELLNGSLLLDLTVTNVTVNSGLTPALFSSAAGRQQ